MTGIVLIRSGSKSIKDKNVQEVSGKPLVYWILNSLEKSKVDQFFLSTDSEEYISLVKSFGFSKLRTHLRKNKETFSDTATSEIAIIDLIREMNIEDDIVFCQATSPLTTFKDIDSCINSYKDYDSVLSVVEQKRFIWNKNGTPQNYEVSNRPRRQDFEGFLVENGAVYINSSANILKDNCRLSGRIGLVKMSDETYLEIDEPSDLIVIEQLMKNRNYK